MAKGVVRIRRSGLLAKALKGQKKKLKKVVARKLEKETDKLTGKFGIVASQESAWKDLVEPGVFVVDPNEPGTGEKVRTSLMIDHTVLAAAKRRARLMGLSFNAYASLALYCMSNPATHPGTAAHQGFAQGFQLASNRPHTPARSPLEKFGPGFSLPAMDGDEACFASWDVVERFAKEQRSHLDTDFITIGKRLGLTPEQIRAADVATGSPEFEAYMEAKYGT